MLNSPVKLGKLTSTASEDAYDDLPPPPDIVRQRYMDPQAGQFLQEDPLEPEEGGDINARRYVFNNPVNLTDPTGMSPFIQGQLDFRPVSPQAA